MPKIKAVFVIVVFAATSSVALYESHQAAQLRGEVRVACEQESALTNHLAEQAAALASAQTRLRGVTEDNGRLAAQVQSLLQRQAALSLEKTTVSTPSVDGPGSNNIFGAMQKMVKTSLAQQVDGKLSVLRTRLNLTPTQEASIREILTRQGTRVLARTRRLLGDDGSGTNEPAKADGDKWSDDQQIKALLSPEQADAYEAFQKEDQLRNARLSANVELIQLQSALQLDEAQQDKVFAALVDQAQARLAGPQPGTGSMADLREQMQRKAEALRPLLTPEQLSAYQHFQEQQLELMEALRQRAGH